MSQEAREPQQKRSIDKKNRIIEAGYELFAKDGYFNTNTSEIAKKAGVSTGIVYGYFHDKRDILIEVLDIYVDNVFYPLGSCTMKYNPKLNEVLARNPAFTSVHPLQPASTVQGSLEVMYDAAKSLAEITGMDEISLEPAAGAHRKNSEFAGNKEVPFVKGRLKAQQDYRARQRARHKPRKRGNVRL